MGKFVSPLFLYIFLKNIDINFMKLSIDLSKNVKKLSSILDSDDIISFNFNLKDRLATAIYTESLADKTMLGKQVVEPISKISSKDINDYLKSVTLPESLK